jgi:hypothetical protein
MTIEKYAEPFLLNLTIIPTSLFSAIFRADPCKRPRQRPVRDVLSSLSALLCLVLNPSHLMKDVLSFPMLRQGRKAAKTLWVS